MKESGARARIIHTDGHLYPELYIGKNKDKKRLLTCLKEIYPSALFQKLYTNNDDGELWLSMDYTESYPGGKNLGKYKLEKMELE
jgi:hypothetical protein